ncbi:MAG: FliM/FliN family flagellar motor switch protein [Vibrio sp.]
MDVIEITELGNPKLLIKKEIERTKEKRDDKIKPLLENLFNAPDIEIVSNYVSEVPNDLFFLDLLVKDKGKLRFSIHSVVLDRLLSIHLNLNPNPLQNHQITESHKSFFLKLCTKALVAIDLPDEELTQIEVHHNRYELHFKYDVLLQGMANSVYISLDNGLANYFSNNIVVQQPIAKEQIETFIKDIPTHLRAVLMKRKLNIGEVNKLRCGDLISFTQPDHVELKINKKTISNAKLVVNENAKLGVKYERS